MKLDRFINRPVLSTVISILIVILGVIGSGYLAYHPIPGHCTSHRIGKCDTANAKRCLTPLSLRWRTRLTVWKI